MTTLTRWGRSGSQVLPGLALCTLLTEAAPTQARGAWASGIFVYADLCTLPGSGTSMGQRVVLRRSPNGDGLTYQGGGAARILPAGALNIDEASKAITFVVETGAGPLHFEGVAPADALTGTVVDAGGVHPVHLPRILRSHAHEPCPDGTTHPAALER